MKQNGIWVMLIGLGVAFLLSAIGIAKEARGGKEIFTHHCAICHGENGPGDGPAARYLFPKPRDLTSGIFKIRTTPSGSLPTDRDLLDILERGIPGTAMPSFGHLSRAEREDLVKHVKSLAKGENGKPLFGGAPPKVVPVGKEPPMTLASVARGRKVYAAMKCAQCHGETGRGDGPAAAELKDEWGVLTSPTDLTRGVFKGGSRPREIVYRFSTGMNGTPMPSYESSLSLADRWNLAHYVKSLSAASGSAPKNLASGARIPARRVPAGELPDRPDHPAWKKSAAVTLLLSPLWGTGSRPDTVAVQALHNGERLVLLLEWRDPALNGLAIPSLAFTDAAAVMFPLAGGEGMAARKGHHHPSFTMGEKGKPVNIWQWRMDRQTDLARFQDEEDLHPHMAVDTYLFETGEARNSGKPGPASAHDRTYLTGYGAGNPMSQISRRSAVEDLVAEGFGTLTAQAAADQNVRGIGLWKDGVWKVIFIRDLNGSSPLDVRLTPGGKMPIAFAVWDGGIGDRDGQKSVTDWQLLELDR